MSKPFLSILSILLLLSEWTTHAEPTTDNNFSFIKLSLEQGLSQTTVSAICQDSDGTLWIGTYKGLNRLVNNRITSYFPIAGDSTSLLDKHIIFIDQDSSSDKGNLWIGTHYGLMRYIRSTDSFEPVRCNGQKVVAYDSCHAPNGIYFAGHKNIYYYDYSTNSLSIAFVNNRYESRYEGVVMLDERTLVLSDPQQGIAILNPHARTITTPQQLAMSIECNATMVDQKGRLWISPYNKGLQCYRYEGNGKFTLLRTFNTANSDLSNDTVLDIAEYNGQMWIATDGGGISIMEHDGEQTSIIKRNDNDSQSIPVNSITRLYCDHELNLWAGTARAGLLGIIQNNIIRYGSSDTGLPKGMTNETILSVYCQKDALYIGTDGGGLNRFDLRTEHFENFNSTKDDKVQSITRLDDQNLLLSIYNQGLMVFNNCTSLKPFIIVNEQIDQSIRQSNMIVNVNRAGNGKIWLTGHIFYCYDPVAKSFSRPENFDEVDGNYYLYLFHTNLQHSFVHDGRSIMRLDNNDMSIDTLFTVERPKRINTISVDSNNTIWFCTNDSLEKVDMVNYSTSTVMLPEATQPDCMVCDNKQRIWIGFGQKVLCYIIDAGKFAIFDRADGVMPNEYFTKAVAVGEQGDIFMGGVTGLLRIKGSIAFNREVYTPMVNLVSLTVDKQPAQMYSNHTQPRVKVPWRFKNIVIRIAVRDADVFRNKSFKYIIEGNNPTTIHSSDELLTLTSLNSGNYTIKVSCNTRDGGWTEPKELFEMKVMPPWWKSTMFIVLGIVSILALSLIVIRHTLRRKERIMMWEMREREKKMADEKVRFLINISHELRTPLTLIYGPLKRLIDATDTNQRVKEELSKIVARTRSITHLINMVLDVRKMEVGHDTLNIGQHNLGRWLAAQADTFADEYRVKRIAIAYNLDPTITTLNFDSAKCETVISNLLMNALKYSPSDTTVTITTERTESGMVRISIIDQGIGLDNTNIDKLFERFYQTSSSNKGNGIGLSYSKMLIEMHHGRIGATNNQAAGSTFWFELPDNLQCAEIKCNTGDYMNSLIGNIELSGEEQTKKRDVSNYSVLIVDDDDELIDYIRSDFDTRFRKVYTARNGSEALDIIKQQIPDVVVSDVMMPVMNGYELCKAVKTNFEISHIPVILLTARTDRQSTTTGYKMGADVYIPKPFDNDFLLTVVDNLLVHRQAVRRTCSGDRLGLQPEQYTFSNADEQFMLKLNTIIDQHIMDTAFDADSICSMMHLSRTTLYRKMQSIVGMGINIYVNRQKIAKAQVAMEQSDQSIAEIAASVGFSDQRYFSTVFKQITGLSPTKYREDKRHSDQ